MRETDNSMNTPALVADFRVRCEWQPQTAALLDIRFVDTDSQSYTSCSVSAVLSSAEEERKNA